MDPEEDPPIHYPTFLGQDESPENIEMAKLLLAHGAFINSTDPGLYTALHVASMLGRPKMCDFLLTNGARYNLRVEIIGSQETPLDLAVEEEDEEVVKALIR